MNRFGERLVIIGGGIAGCFAAGALSPFFKETIVLDQDELPQVPHARKGVSQGSHIHGLLRRPIDIACELFPGFEERLRAAGGIPLIYGSQARFHDAGAWQPKRDLGIKVYSQSRALLEHVLREDASRLKGVEFRSRVTVTDYVVEDCVVKGVLMEEADGTPDILDADLVVDASGRGSDIVSLLKAHGFGDVDAVEFGVGIAYSSAFFTRSSQPGEEPHANIIRGNAPNTKSGVMFPVEGDRWIISLSGRFKDHPPADDDGFFAFAKELEDPILYETIRRESRVSDYSRFLIPRIYWRHFEAMERFPSRLLPIGDTVTGFNPVYGQGMAVASLHAIAIRDALNELTIEDDPLSQITQIALPRIANGSATAWNMSAPVDLVYTETTGERPLDLVEKTAFSKYVRQRIETDPELHARFFRVMNLLEPGTVVQEWIAENP